MKQILFVACLIGFALIMTVLPLLPALAESPDYTDDTAYPRFVGRLYIPEVGIDVALYRSNKQAVVDRDDSAAYFDLATHPYHMIVADHWTEAFATLKDVTVGMEASINHADGTTTHYKCVEVLDGHNTGHIITDGNYKEVVSKSDLLTYTCINGWKNVRVVLWDVKEDEGSNEASGICSNRSNYHRPLHAAAAFPR